MFIKNINTWTTVHVHINFYLNRRKCLSKHVTFTVVLLEKSHIGDLSVLQDLNISVQP